MANSETNSFVRNRALWYPCMVLRSWSKSRNLNIRQCSWISATQWYPLQRNSFPLFDKLCVVFWFLRSLKLVDRLHFHFRTVRIFDFCTHIVLKISRMLFLSKFYWYFFADERFNQRFLHKRIHEQKLDPYRPIISVLTSHEECMSLAINSNTDTWMPTSGYLHRRIMHAIDIAHCSINHSFTPHVVIPGIDMHILVDKLSLRNVLQ